MLRVLAAAVLAFVPLGAAAQVAPAHGPVTVEIVASGQVVVPAQTFRLSVKVSGKGADEKTAGEALAANRAKLVQALAAIGVRETKAGTAPASNSLMGMFAGIAAARGKPTFAQDLAAFDADNDAPPQTIASDTVMFDASSRAAAADARKAAETAGGEPEEAVLALLDDYVAPKRKAKADALRDAQGEAEAYAAALGLRKVAIVKVSERQDAVGGTMGFLSELIGAFMPAGSSTSDDVTVQANITVEFQLAR